MLKTKPAKAYHQKLSYCKSEYEPKQSNFDFESAREVLMKGDYKMDVKRRFEKIHNIMECKSYMRNEDILENTDIFFMDSNILKQIKSIFKN